MMKRSFRTTLFNGIYVVGYHTSDSNVMKTLVTQHYTYTDDHVNDILFSMNRLLAHAHNMANDNRCAFTGKFMGLEGRYIVIYYKLQMVVRGRTRYKAQIRCFDVLCTLDAHLDSILLPIVQWICPPSHQYVHLCCPQCPVCLCLDAYDLHILDEMTLHDDPGIYLGEQPLSKGHMKLPLFHAEGQQPSMPLPTSSPPNVILDRYILDLTLDSDSDATAELAETEPIADNEGILDPDNPLPSDANSSNDESNDFLNLN